MLATNNIQNKCYVCKICNFDHEIPAQGFFKCKAIADLINQNSHLTEDQKKIKDMLQSFQETIKKLNGFTADPSNYLYDYIAELKRLVDLQREEFKKQVDDISLKIIEQIDKLYKEVKESLEKLDKSEMKVDFDKFNKVIKYSEEYIRMRTFDEKKLKELVDKMYPKERQSIAIWVNPSQYGSIPDVELYLVEMRPQITIYVLMTNQIHVMVAVAAQILGDSYAHPLYKRGSFEAQFFLAGSPFFFHQ